MMMIFATTAAATAGAAIVAVGITHRLLGGQIKNYQCDETQGGNL
jgi:hypothetical protein